VQHTTYERGNIDRWSAAEDLSFRIHTFTSNQMWYLVETTNGMLNDPTVSGYDYG
jgi:hypothetical protein